jgi:hypothetical protein
VTDVTQNNGKIAKENKTIQDTVVVPANEAFGDGAKYKLNFKGQAKKIEPIKFARAPQGIMQSPRYTSIEKLLNAKSWKDVFCVPNA